MLSLLLSAKPLPHTLSKSLRQYWHQFSGATTNTRWLQTVPICLCQVLQFLFFFLGHPMPKAQRQPRKTSHFTRNSPLVIAAVVSVGDGHRRLMASSCCWLDGHHLYMPPYIVHLSTLWLCKDWVCVHTIFAHGALCKVPLCALCA